MGGGEWGWKGARGKKKKRRAKAIRFIGSSVPLVQLVSSWRAMRAATTTRRSLIIPWRSLFFLFLLPVAASQIFRLGFGSEEKKKKEKKKRLQIVKVERKRERASFVVVVTRAHASRDCDSRSITERARSVNKKSIRFTEVKVN